MPKYDFPVPRSRGGVTNDCDVTESSKSSCTKDIIMHMLLARVATEGNETIEVAPFFNALINALEIDVPEDILEAIESINIGPNLQRFMNWISSSGGLDTIQLNPNIDAPAHSEGLLFYDRDHKALAVYNNEADVTLQVGQDTWILVVNDTGSTITNGQAVRITGANGAGLNIHGAPTIALAKADAEGTSFAVGLATHDIEADSFGFITAFGIVHDLDTSAFSNGDLLWLSPVTAGAWTNVKPSQPNVVTEIGLVINSGVSDGSIFTKPEFANYYTKNQVDNLIANIEAGVEASTNVLVVTQIIGSSSSGFESVGQAIDEINSFVDGPNEATAANRYVISVLPGTYIEDPLTVPKYVTVQGLNDEASIIEADNNNSPLFTMSDESQVYNLRTIGPTNNVAMLVSGNIEAEFVGCAHQNCLTAIQVDGAGTEASIKNSNIKSDVTTGILATNDGECHAQVVLSEATNHFYANGGDIHVLNAHTEGGTNCLYANNGGRILPHNVLAHGCTNVVRTGLVGTNEISGHGVTSEGGTSTWDVLQENADGDIHLTSSIFLATKISMVNADEVRINFSSSLEGDEGTLFYEELQVGSPEQGRETVLGEGDSYVRGMLVYTYEEGGAPAYVDVSTAARSASLSPFTFPALAQHNAIYISSDLQDSSDYKQFLGIKASVTTAAVLNGGEIVVEYWDSVVDGGSWVEFNHMSAGGNAPYTHYADAIFERTGSEQIRFDDLTDTTRFTWGKNDDPGVDANDRFWVRFRISSAIDTAPIFQQFKIHTNRTEINADGFVEFMGKARKTKALEGINFGNTYEVDGFAPKDNNVDFGAIINLKVKKNELQDGSIDGFGQAIAIPDGLDTSLPLKYVVRWAPSSDENAGDVALDFVYGQAQVGTVLDGNNIETTITDITTTTANTEDQIYETEYLFSIPDSLPEDGLFIVLRRDANGGATGDDYGGDVYIVNVELLGTFWH